MNLCSWPKRRRKLQITQSVVEEIRKTIGSRPAEEGGILGGSRSDGIVTHFYFDESAHKTRATYSPDHKLINKLLSEEWNPAGVNLLGFVHSQPPGVRRPSQGDLDYAREILSSIPDLKRLLLPIVMSIPDNGKFEAFAYAAVPNGQTARLEEMELLVVDRGKVKVRKGKTLSVQKSGHPANLDETFRQVQNACDLECLGRSRIISIGVGGAVDFPEDMARSGVGEQILIDHDVVSESNLATQRYYRKDIGRPKVDCIAERIKDINPNAVVIARQQRLEEIDDAEFKHLAKAPLREQPPVLTLLCGFTDAFKPQARVNRLGLHFGLPTLCAQVYREGRAAEITFTYPGVTTACHRCVLSFRYKAYLEQGYRSDITSAGTPIFLTSRLNALKSQIAMAMLHHGTNHPRWGGLLQRIGNRNLIQIRMHPDAEPALGLTIFGKVFGGGDQERILFDDVVWLPQKPDCPENGYPRCPDCGGTGDLRNAIGTFDTKMMRR